MDLIEIPEEELKAIRGESRERCESGSLMPRFSAKIQYVCARKTHFVHAHKLAIDGTRTVFSAGDEPIRWPDSDAEGKLILGQGPFCALCGSNLLHDIGGTSALCSDDNLNAGVQWGEDEVQVFGRVHEMVVRLAASQGSAPSQGGASPTADALITSLQVSGVGQFSCKEWKEFIAFRMSLPGVIAKTLQTCQLSACGGRVRVKPSDFGLAAKLDPRAPWAKVAVLLWQHIGSADQNHASASVENIYRSSGNRS